MIPPNDVTMWPIVTCAGVRWYVAPRMIGGGQPISDSMAKAHGCELPSPDLVVAVQAAADCKLDALMLVRTKHSSPPNDYGPKGMQSAAVIANQEWCVERAVNEWKAEHGTEPRLVAGSHKDIVMADRDYPTLRRGRLGIFGWYRSDGRPIQPLSGVHAVGYFDYSHGVRLCQRVERLAVAA